MLSCGERVRCILARLMLSGANCLILDEPTNHLDLEAIEALDEGLVDFSGVLLFTSHDHEFVTFIANRIVEICPGGLIDRRMSFDEYPGDAEITELRDRLYHGHRGRDLRAWSGRALGARLAARPPDRTATFARTRARSDGSILAP